MLYFRPKCIVSVLAQEQGKRQSYIGKCFNKCLPAKSPQYLYNYYSTIHLVCSLCEVTYFITDRNNVFNFEK